MDTKFLRKASHRTCGINILIATIRKGSHPAAFLCYICFMLDIDTIKVTYHGDRNIDTEEFLKQYTKLISTVNREFCSESLFVKYSIREYKFKDGYVMFRLTGRPGYTPFDFFAPTDGPIDNIPEIYDRCCRDFISTIDLGDTPENKTEPDTVGFSFGEKVTVFLLLLFIAFAITWK
jgi:hypothetical protein